MVTRGKSPEILAYAAGVVDGEGSIGMNRTFPKANWKGRGKSPRYEYTVTVNNTCLALIEWLHSEFGGCLNKKPIARAHWLPQWAWRISSFQAADFCRVILPYLRVKRAQALLLIDFQENKTSQRGGRGLKSSDEEIAWRDEIYIRMCALNRTQPQRLSERTPTTKVG